jgi:hypothetical protein
MHYSEILNGEIGPMAGRSRRRNHPGGLRDYCVLANKPFEIGLIKPLRCEAYLPNNTTGSPMTLPRNGEDS